MDFQQIDYMAQVLSQSIAEAIRDERPTLRDRFAMIALQGLMLRFNEPGYTEEGAIAEAFAIADLMLAARKAKP